MHKKNINLKEKWNMSMLELGTLILLRTDKKKYADNEKVYSWPEQDCQATLSI